MRKYGVFLLLMTLLTTVTIVSAHSVDFTNLKVREWSLNDNTKIQGTFLMLKNNAIYVERIDGSVVHFPLDSFCNADKAFAQERQSAVQKLNTSSIYSTQHLNGFDWRRILIVCVFFLVITLFIYQNAGHKRLQYITYFLFVGVLGTIYGFRKAAFNQLTSTTSPSFIDSAFAPFRPNVATYYDNNYFYIESKGIPATHQMMVGISNHGWQQQVPIPQCYFNPNSWPIPLNPTMAASPIPVDSVHFTRGAIAIAANGVPIFNVHTNTGVDSYLDGQLDDFGGHCGRADDYHYHIAPLHLYNYTSASLPIAFGLDGFAVYGSVEPDGSSMQTLDANHGHFGSDGVYHYHGTASAPYMIAQMAGQVTEDNTHQLIPQAAAHPFRPSRTPLSGALITSCVVNGANNGYTLTYTKSGLTYQIDYSWDAAGNYTFHYINPTGTLDSIYHGFTQCSLPTAISEVPFEMNLVQIFPNPAQSRFTLLLNGNIKTEDVRNISLHTVGGQIVYSINHFQPEINTAHLEAGVYCLTVKTDNRTLVKKLIIQ